MSRENNDIGCSQQGRFFNPDVDPRTPPSEIQPSEEDPLNLKEEEEDALIGCDVKIKLYQAVLNGDMEKIKHIQANHVELETCKEDDIETRGVRKLSLMKARITKGGDTMLHIAAAAKQLHIVEELVRMMDDDSLALKNGVGNTALCLAVVTGVVEIAKVMVDKLPSLLNIRGSQEMTPLLMAVLMGQQDMASYLLSIDKLPPFTNTECVELLTSSIHAGLFAIAKRILCERKCLAVKRDANNETALHALARKTPKLDRYQLSMWQKFKMQMQGISTTHVEPKIVLELTQMLWDEIIKLNHKDISKLICFPSRLLFVAAELGKVEFLAVLINSYPDIIWKVDENRYSIFHIAVIHRHEEIFKLIYETGAIKDLLATYIDNHENNMLHLASKLAPFDRLHSVSGAALQMQHELLWFEAVKKIVQPQYGEAKNKDKKKPHTMFSEEHEALRIKGEEWMKKTAEACALVAALIVTVAFPAAFQLPGGTDNDGKPVLVKRTPFVVFAVADAASLFTSTASLLMFISILTSRYAERDFLVSLPSKLMKGLILLLISIAAMMVAFTATFFITFKDDRKWVRIPMALIAAIPVMLFAFQQFPLLVDIYHSTYKSEAIFQPSRKMLFKSAAEEGKHFPQEDVNNVPLRQKASTVRGSRLDHYGQYRTAPFITNPLASEETTCKTDISLHEANRTKG